MRRRRADDNRWLFRIALGDGVPSGPVVAAPVLLLTSGPTDLTPDFTLTGDLVLGDTVRFQYATALDFAGTSELTNAIDAGEDAANAISFSTGSLATGTWYFRARIERPALPVSNWSNTETITLSVSAYTGPGNIVTTAKGWWGLRAYNAAYATGSNPAIDIVKSSDGTALQTINILSTGALDVATIAALGYAVRVTKIYDQSGNGYHLAQPTLAKMPTLVLNAIGSLPGLAFDGVDDFLGNVAGTFSMTQPYTYSAVFKATVAQAFGDILSCTTPECDMGYDGAAQQVIMYAGTLQTVSTYPINAFYAVHAHFNGASSVLDVNGTSATKSPGTDNPLNSGIAMGSYGSGTAIFAPVVITEAGMWDVGFTAGDITNVTNNQRTYWGF